MLKKLFSNLTIVLLFILFINMKCVFAVEDLSGYYNNYESPKGTYKQGVESPFSKQGAGEEERIDTATGSLEIKHTDLSLSGRNGLDVNLTRFYNQSHANLYEPGVSSSPVYDNVVIGYKLEGTEYVTKVRADGVILEENSYILQLEGYNTYYEAQQEADAYNSGYHDFDSILYYDYAGDYYYYNQVEYFGFNVYEKTQQELIDYAYYDRVEGLSYNDKYFDIGAGWAFDLPSIEIRGGYSYLNYGSGGVWQISFGSEGGESHLVSYPLKDIILNSDSGTYSNGQYQSSYVLTEKDGKKTYFSSTGRILGTKDCFENEIKYQYANRNGYEVISKIIDSMQREINISYSGNQVIITATDSTNPQNNKTILYNKTEITDHSGRYVLSNVVDSENRQVRYEYFTKEARVSLRYKNTQCYIDPNTYFNGCTNYYACLSKIIYPTGGETLFSYQKFIKNCGKDGSMNFYKVTDRFDNGAGPRTYNYRQYIYKYNGTDEYDGYPNYFEADNLPTTYLVKTQIKDYFNNSEIHTYNYKLLRTNVLREGADHKNETNIEYDLTKKLPIKIINKIYNKATGQFIEQVENFDYDLFGDVLGHWDIQADRDANKIPLNDEHKTTYTYHSIYHYVTSKTYKKDINTTIREENTPSSSDGGKTIEWTKIFENNVLKDQSQYIYDIYGNLIEERNYLDDWINFIATKYSYSNGVYLSRKWVEGIQDADGNLIAPKLGNASGVIDENYTYDGFGDILSKQDGNGATTTYQYDKLGRILKETQPDGSFKSWSYNDTENSVTKTDENRL